MSDSWIILRCGGQRTLKLAESLNEDGFNAWTPVERKRYPGKKAKFEAPLMPTFVFASADRMDELLAMSASPSPKVPFSVFHYFTRIPAIAESELRPLRLAEARSAPENEWPSFAPHQIVRATDGPYCGHSGKVIRSRGEWAMVLFDWHKVKISCFFLQPTSAISPDQALRRIAA